MKPPTSSTTETSPSASWPSVTAPIVKSLSSRRDAGGGVDRLEDRVDRPVAVNVPVAEPPSGSVTATRACGGRSEEASTSNHSSA